MFPYEMEHFASVSFLCLTAPQIAVVHAQDVANQRHAEHRVGGDPRHGIGGAQRIERQRGRCGADRAACHGGGQQQAYSDAGHQLRAARAQHKGRPPDALHAVADEEDAAQKRVHGEIHIEERIAEAHRLLRHLVGAEKHMEIQVVDRQQQTDARRAQHHDPHDRHALQRALPDAVVPPRPQILGGEAGHGRAQRVHGRRHQTGQLIGRTEAVLGGAGHHAAVQHVELHHHALHDDDTDGQHGELQSQRDAPAHMAAHIVQRDVPVLPLQPDVRIAGKGVAEAGHGADELGGHGGGGRTGHTPVEPQDEQ